MPKRFAFTPPLLLPPRDDAEAYFMITAAAVADVCR